MRLFFVVAFFGGCSAPSGSPSDASALDAIVTADAGVPADADVGCAVLNGRCVARHASADNCAGIGYEYRAPVCDTVGDICCVMADSTGALPPALSDYGICFDLLCAAGHQCMQGTDSAECSSEPVSPPVDGGADGGTDAEVGEPCGLIHCTPPMLSPTCHCMDVATSHCSC